MAKGMDFLIEVKDYQSLEKVKIVVKDGLNVVLGNNNAGKSAVFRAVDEAVFNRGDDSKVRVGKRYSGVHLNNGEHDLIYRRDSHGKNNKTLYQIDNNPKPVEKVGRVQLPEVQAFFNITEVKMSNNHREKLNFWAFGDLPFLTDRTAGQLYEFLSLSSCEKYLEVLKSMKADIKDLTSKTNTVTVSIDTLEKINEDKKAFLDKNEGFEELYKRAVILNSEVRKFNEIEAIAQRVMDLQSKLETKTAELEKVSTLLTKLDFTGVALLFGQVKGIDARVDKVNSLQERLTDRGEELKTVTDRLSKIDFIKAQVDCQEVFDLDNSIAVLRDKFTNIDKKNKQFKATKQAQTDVTERYTLLKGVADSLESGVQEVLTMSHSVSNMGSLVTSVVSKQEKMDELKDKIQDITLQISGIDLGSFSDEIRRLVDIESNIVKMDALVKRYENGLHNYSSKVGELAQVTADYEAKSREFNNFKEIIGVCPYCEGELNHTH